MPKYITSFEKAKLIAALRRMFIEENLSVNTKEVIEEKILNVLKGISDTSFRLERIYNFQTMEVIEEEIKNLIINIY